jgi:hypothetical protein
VSLLSIGLKVYLQIYVGTVLQVKIKILNNFKSLVDANLHSWALDADGIGIPVSTTVSAFIPVVDWFSLI